MYHSIAVERFTCAYPLVFEGCNCGRNERTHPPNRRVWTPSERLLPRLYQPHQKKKTIRVLFFNCISVNFCCYLSKATIMR